MAVQSPCLGWGRGGSPNKESGQDSVPWFLDYLVSGVGRNLRKTVIFLEPMAPARRWVSRTLNQGACFPGQAEAVSDGLYLGRWWMALGEVSPGESLSGRVRSRVREPDQQLLPVFTVPHSSGATGGSSSCCRHHLCLFLPSLEPRKETTVSLLTRGCPAALARLVSQVHLPRPPCLFWRGGSFTDLSQTFSSLCPPTPHPRPQVTELKVNCFAWAPKDLEWIPNCFFIGKACGCT